MPLIWCSISGHGFGHAAQVVPVLNALAHLVPNLHVVLRTEAPDWFFRHRLQVPWKLNQIAQDVGCVQHGPLQIDVKETWAAYAEFHRNWNTRVTDEMTAIKHASPNLVLSDIAYLPLEAGVRASVRTIGLSSLSWDVILKSLDNNLHSDQLAIIDRIQRSYRYAGLMVRAAPALQMPAFEKTVDVAPIISPVASNPAQLRVALSASSDDCIVAISFGGIPLMSLPWERLENMRGYRFIVSGTVPPSSKRVISAETIPMTVQSIMASSDVLLTKPGYGTIVEAVAMQRRVVYVRRYNFADEDILLTYLNRFGRGVELSAADFLAGRWENALNTVATLSTPTLTPPLANGAAEAADLLASYL